MIFSIIYFPSFIVYLKVVNTDKLSDFPTQIEEKMQITVVLDKVWAVFLE